MTDFMIGLIAGAGIMAIIVMISMAKAAKCADELETEIISKEHESK